MPHLMMSKESLRGVSPLPRIITGTVTFSSGLLSSPRRDLSALSPKGPGSCSVSLGSCTPASRTAHRVARDQGEPRKYISSGIARAGVAVENEG